MSDNSFAMFPIVVVEDRYMGVYSGFRWLAFPKFDEDYDYVKDLYDGAWGDDVTAAGWAADNQGRYWGGNTPDEAVENLRAFYPNPQPNDRMFDYGGAEESE